MKKLETNLKNLETKLEKFGNKLKQFGNSTWKKIQTEFILWVCMYHLKDFEPTSELIYGQILG